MVILSEEVRVGRLEGLRALRDVLAGKIEHGPQGEKQVDQTAALSRQLRDTLKEIADLEKSLPKASVVDDLASRRRERNSPAGDATTAGSVPE